MGAYINVIVMMMTKLEMPVNSNGSNMSAVQLLSSSSTNSNSASRLINVTSAISTTSNSCIKMEDISISQQQSTSAINPSVLSSHTPIDNINSAASVNDQNCINSSTNRFRLPNASPNPENNAMESDDLGPVSRDRCNTWPLRRPQLDINAQTSPLIHEQIPEEDNDLYDSTESISNGRLGANSTAGLMGSPDNGAFSPGMSSPVPCGNTSGQVPPSSAGSDTSDPGTTAPGSNKKSTTRRNAWGNMSYADLITQAIMSSAEKRLTLSQVYEWMVQNVPYFRDKGDSNSSAGWKNSIRHNLSLHSRFMRIQNEGAGKSSWWVINPDAKPGRNPRRQRSATLENTTKAAIEKKRRGARKKAMELRAAGTLHSASSSVVGSQASIISHELYGDNDDSLGNFEPLFRPRTQSNLSITASSSRVSPSMTTDHFDDFDFPPFVEAGAMPHDILDRTNEMNLNTHPESSVFQRAGHNPMLNGSVNQSQAQSQPSAASSSSSASSLLQHIKSEPTPPNSIKNEANGVQPPPSYHELNAVRGVSHLQNPLLRTHLIQNRLPPPAGLPYNGLYSTATGTALPNWIHTGGAQLIPGLHSQISCSAQQTLGPTAALPLDLENLTLPDQPLMELDNMEAVLRHELSQSTSNQLSFDNI